MRLGIKGKQILGVTSIVGLAVVGLSAMHLASMARISLEESRARGELLANAIFHRAREVVGEQPDPYAALRRDGGLRSILESSIYSKNVTYAAIVDASGVVVAHSDPGREGQPLAEGGDLTALLTRSSSEQLETIYSEEGRTLEVRQPLLMGSTQFGSIRIGVSTLLIRRELDAALRPPIITAFVALLVAMAVSMLMAQLLLRPIHIIRTGLTRLGKGEEGVTFDLQQHDEFGELGTFFNAVSAQLSADRTALAEKANLESAVEHLEDAVALFNPEGELLFANPAMRITLPEAPFGRPIDDTLPAGHPYRTIVEDTLASRESRGPMSEFLPPATEERPQEGGAGTERLIMTHVIEGRDRQMMGVMLVARNLSYLGQVRSTINYSRKLMALGRLTAGVAHEVKNPLNAMMIHLELLRNKLSSAQRARAATAEAAVGAASHSGGAASTAVVAAPIQDGGLDVPAAMEHVGIITDAIRRLDQVLQGFLKFTRPEDLKLQVIELAELLRDVTRVVGPEAEKSGVSIEVQSPRDLPDLRGDSGMLRQAFLNLALNACQAMPSGGTLRISGAPASRRRVEVSFEDTGVGIDRGDLERIFELYFTTKPQGSGIGLSLVYRIVQLHDGEIEVVSTPGVGTRFLLLLPQA